MTTPHEPPPASPAGWFEASSPTIADPDRVPIPLYTEEFADDPHGAYDEWRKKYGSLVPVELSPGIPATLVIGYSTAIRINNDPERFPADPRAWQKNIPLDCPVLPMLEHRPNALRSGPPEHARYRKANVDSIDGIDLTHLPKQIEQIAIPQINTFCLDGQADLISQYAFPVTFAYLNAMVGCTPDIGERVAKGMAQMFEATDAGEGSAMFAGALAELVALKRVAPGNDVTTRLLNHSAKLNGEELVHQLVTDYGAGIEPLTNLIANTLLLMLTDDRFFGHAALTTADALNEKLFGDSPLANFLITYPRQPILVDDVWLPANQPVVTSLAACNNDPAVVGDLNVTANRSHIAWGTGPHVCPANTVAFQVAHCAIDQLLDHVPDVRVAKPLKWRPGPFHRSLVELPVVFSPSRNTF
ncbi:cytochrome P450 [Nocardia sp. NBC_00403]